MDARERLMRAIALAEEWAESSAQWYARVAQLRALAQLLPGLGGAIDAALATVAGNVAERQLEEWMGEIEREIAHLASQVAALAGRLDDPATLASPEALALLPEAVAAAEAARATGVFPGATPIDALMLAACCRAALETGSATLETQVLQMRQDLAGLPTEDVLLSVRLLADHGLIRPITGQHGRPITHFTLEPLGFNRYAWAALGDYPALVRRIAQTLYDLAPATVEDYQCPGGLDSQGVAKLVRDSEIRARFALLWLKAHGYVKTHAPLSMGERIGGLSITPLMRRFLHTPLPGA